MTYRAITYYSRGAGQAAAHAAPPADAGGGRAVNAEGAAEGLRRTTSPHASKAAGGRAADTADASGRGTTVEVDAEEPPAPMFDAGLINGKALSLPRPAYPVSRARPSAVFVTVEVVVDETGRVISARGRGGPRALWRGRERRAARGILPVPRGRAAVRARGRLEYTFPFDPR